VGPLVCGPHPFPPLQLPSSFFFQTGACFCTAQGTCAAPVLFCGTRRAQHVLTIASVRMLCSSAIYCSSMSSQTSQNGRRMLVANEGSFPNDNSRSYVWHGKEGEITSRKAPSLPSGPNKPTRVSPPNSGPTNTPPRTLDLLPAVMDDCRAQAAQLELETISEQSEALRNNMEAYDAAMAISDPTARLPHTVAVFIMDIATHFKLLPATPFLAIELAGQFYFSFPSLLFPTSQP
jgi:hypothetical protein